VAWRVGDVDFSGGCRMLRSFSEWSGAVGDLLQMQVLGVMVD